MQPDLAALAGSQGGPFSRAQALAAGYSPGAVRSRVHTGDWIVLRRGVYVPRDLWERYAEIPGRRHAIEIGAAVLALGGNRTVGSHRSAALTYDLGMLGEVPSVVTVTRPPGAPGRDLLRGVHVHRAGLPDPDVWERYGVPVTTPARTVIDLARALPFREGVVVADSALHQGLTGSGQLHAVLATCHPWPGINRAEAVVAFADAGAETALESVARVMFAERGLPRPETQVEIADSDGPFARVDFLWRAYRTIGEADGLLKYTDAEVLRAEKMRQERLESLGYQVVRFTWHQVIYEPSQTAARIRAAFARSLRAA